MSFIKETVAATKMNLEGLPSRLGASFVIVVGVATTVAVMISLLAISAGLQKTSARNIGPDVAIVVPSGAQSEYAGSISRDDVALVVQAPGIRKDRDGQPMAAPNAIVVVEVTRKADGVTTNIGLRGVTTRGLLMDRNIRLTQGRLYRPAVHELIVGKNVNAQFKDFGLGDRVVLRGTEWTIVGIFEANGSLAENSIVGDADTVMAAFERNAYQSVEARLQSPAAFQTFKDALTANPQLDVEAKRYADYVQEQLKQVTGILDFVGYFVGAVMAIGAIIGAINTMYSAVDARTREIATLRAIGFSGLPVVVSVLIESLALAIPGALLGAAVAWVVFNGHVISTFGLTFPLAVTAPLVVSGVGLSLLIGVLGGALPALRAAGVPVATALRAT